MADSPIAKRLLTATRKVCRELNGLEFSEPVTHVYNPLTYAKKSHYQYIERFGATQKSVLFMGMNPGPWGMAQTGIPFGEIAAVRDWMGIEESVQKPKIQHPKRPIEGFACEKSEVSGRRLWGLFAEHYPKPEAFFKDYYIVNYCPLVWMEESGRNRTPDKVAAREMEPVIAACDRYVLTYLEQFQPDYVVGVGAYAEKCLKRICKSSDLDPVIGKLLHPSPASPAANKDWAGKATKQLQELGIW